MGVVRKGGLGPDRSVPEGEDRVPAVLVLNGMSTFALARYGGQPSFGLPTVANALGKRLRRLVRKRGLEPPRSSAKREDRVTESLYPHQQKDPRTRALMLVRKRGLEPPRSCGRQPLKLLDPHNLTQQTTIGRASKVGCLIFSRDLLRSSENIERTHGVHDGCRYAHQC